MHAHRWESEGSYPELVLFLSNVAPRDGTQMPQLSGQCLLPTKLSPWLQDLFFQNIHKSNFLGKPKSALYCMTDGETPFCRDRLMVS